MRLALIRLADRERPAQQFDRFLQAMGFFNNLVVGLPLQLLRSLYCFIYAMRHAWSSGGAPAKNEPGANLVGLGTLPAGMPILHCREWISCGGVTKCPELALSVVSEMSGFPPLRG